MRHHLSKKAPPYYTILTAIFLMLLALLAYANTFEAPFVFDDLPNITGNPRVRMTQLTPASLIATLKIQPDNRPLGYTSFALNYYLDRYDVSGYHIVNLTVHIITALLIFLVARQTLRLCHSESTLIPWFTAALWLVNPVHTQSVTYIVQRMNSLAAMFFMLALFCYIQARMTDRDGQARIRSFLFYVLCLIATVLGLASKQTVITLPVFLLLYEWVFFRNLDRPWLQRQLRWISVAVILLAVIILVYLKMNVAGRMTILYEKNDFTLGQRLLTQPRVIVYYLSLLFFPHLDRLNVDYDFPLSFSLANPAVTVLALLALGALLGAALYRPDRHRLLSFTILWFLGNLAIESSVIGLALIFEHRTYLPSLFIVFAFTALLLRHLPRSTSVIILCVLITISCIWTHQRNAVWGDTLSFWQDCAKKSPDKARPANGVGTAFQTHHQPEKALEWFQKALQLDPSDGETYCNIGVMLVKQDQYAEALPYLERAIALDPQNHKAFSNLGTIMHRLNRIDEAIAYYRKSLSIYPHYETAHSNLGATLTETGDIEGAIRHLNRAIQINPGFPDAFNNLGLAMMKLGQTQAAINYYQEGLRLNPESGTTHFNLATALFQQQDLDRSRYHLQEAVRIDPSSILALNNLATVLLATGQADQALPHLVRIMELSPDHLEANINIGIAYDRLGNPDKGIFHLNRAVFLAPDHPGARAELGLLLLRQGKVADARTQLEKALALQPDFPRARLGLASVLEELEQKEAAVTQDQAIIADHPDH